MESIDAILNRVIEFASHAHRYQKRKYTAEPYIVHPIRVMGICKGYTRDIPVLAAAILHDVLEDTPTSKEEIITFLNTVMDETSARRTVNLVIELSDVYVKQHYPKWNRRKRKSMEAERMEKTSKEAQTIKYADIIDNANEIVGHDASFAKIFLYECQDLLKRMIKGDQELYKNARLAVKEKIKELGNPEKN